MRGLINSVPKGRKIKISSWDADSCSWHGSGRDTQDLGTKLGLIRLSLAHSEQERLVFTSHLGRIKSVQRMGFEEVSQRRFWKDVSSLTLRIKTPTPPP